MFCISILELPYDVAIKKGCPPGVSIANIPEDGVDYYTAVKQVQIIPRRSGRSAKKP